MVKDSIIVVYFKTEGKLTLIADKGFNGFEVASVDKYYCPVRTRLSGNKLVVSSPNVAKPVTAIYAWSNNPKVVLPFSIPSTTNQIILKQKHRIRVKGKSI